MALSTASSINYIYTCLLDIMSAMTRYTVGSCALFLESLPVSAFQIIIQYAYMTLPAKIRDIAILR